jgi:signal transduction histidine kinase
LNITKKIVKKFNGEIGFRSEHNIGSTFSFSFRLENDLKNLDICDYFESLKELSDDSNSCITENEEEKL